MHNRVCLFLAFWPAPVVVLLIKPFFNNVSFISHLIAIMIIMTMIMIVSFCYSLFLDVCIEEITGFRLPFSSAVCSNTATSLAHAFSGIQRAAGCANVKRATSWPRRDTEPLHTLEISIILHNVTYPRDAGCFSCFVPAP